MTVLLALMQKSATNTKGYILASKYFKADRKEKLSAYFNERKDGCYYDII